jgi:uncharacterized protein (DUF3820 family)
MENPTPAKRLTFGKYKGRLISDIIKINLPYIKWLLKLGKIKLPKNLTI